VKRRLHDLAERTADKTHVTRLRAVRRRVVTLEEALPEHTLLGDALAAEVTELEATLAEVVRRRAEDAESRP